MYIGPWQEYNLSKEKKLLQANQMPSDVRKGIEDVLLQSLDPNAAKAALQAMNQYFQQQAKNTTPRSTNDSLQADFISLDWKDANNHTLRPVRPNIPKAHKNPRSINNRAILQLPPIDTNLILDPDETNNTQQQTRKKDSSQALTVTSVLRAVNSARESGHQGKGNGAPLSVRSSKSEPVQPSNRLPKIKDLPPSSSSSIPTPTTSSSTSTNKSYDSNAIVNFLRMERNERAKNEISKLTGWERSTKKNNGGNNSTIKLQPLSTHEQKLQQIQHMKELYLQQNQQATASNKLLLEPINAPTAASSPLKGRIIEMSDSFALDEDETPIVTDLEITEQDLLKVSKYFESMNLAHLLSNNLEGKTQKTQNVLDRGNAQLLPTPKKEINPTESNPNSPGKQLITPRKPLLPIESITDEDDGDTFTLSRESVNVNSVNNYVPKTQSRQLSAPNDIQNGLKSPLPLHDGGVDGLLSWTKNLNLDDF